APDSQQESSPLSGRKSTQATVRICGASSKLSKEGLTKSKCYIFSDASAYREHMAARDIYKPEEPGGANPRPAAKVTAAKFDIDLVRAYLAVGRSPPEA
ncbi:hypothetical protein, partial [Bradyrhizobium liaoningense]|uniref:hypothetical protein n=1 Tax=Bradyrhizobium liaoningense TaxID=43992 RepID=UPI001BA8A46F